MLGGSPAPPPHPRIRTPFPPFSPSPNKPRGCVWTVRHHVHGLMYTSIPHPSFSPSLISLVVSVDIRHHVHGLMYTSIPHPHPLSPVPNKPRGFCGRSAPCSRSYLPCPLCPGGGSSANTLKKVNMEKITNGDCSHRWSNVSGGRYQRRTHLLLREKAKAPATSV